MRLNINLDRIGIGSLDNAISALLKEKDLPECIGKMVLPTMQRIITVDNTRETVIKPLESVLEEDRIKIPDQSIRGTEVELDVKDYTLTQEGLDKLTKYKKNKADDYVRSVVACKECPESDLCFQLTLCYLTSLSLLTNGGS